MKSNPKIVAGKFVMETFFDKNPHIDYAQQLRQIQGIIADTKSTNENLAFAAKRRIRQGYRKGVYLVALRNVTGFKRRIRELVPGDYLFGEYKPRVKNEKPRKRVKVLHVGELPDAEYVDAVLYARNVLAESGDEHDPTCDYELVTFLAKDSPEEEPMDVETLLHNHFLSDGGTSTKMSDKKFVKALRESFNHWKHRAHIH